MKKSPVLDIQMMLWFHSQLVNKCPYRFGSKWKDGLKVSHLVGMAVDCSGYIVAQFRRCAINSLSMPDGSYIQHDAVRKWGWKKLASYDEVLNYIHDPDTVVICFIAPTKDKAGHVFEVYKGMTYESRGGHGVDNQSWRAYQNFPRQVFAYLVPTRNGSVMKNMPEGAKQ